MAGVILFQCVGNPNRGYIDTNSLFYWWIYQWWNPDSETQHGWLILAVAVGLFVRNVRAQTNGAAAVGGVRRAVPAGPRLTEDGSSYLDWSAVAAMLLALALHALGFVAQQARVSILALLLFAWGTLRLAGGRRWGAAAAFPLAFLVFAIPLNALDSVGFWLRLWVIRASAAIAHAGGIAVFRNGTQLVSPDGRYNYDVAAACSGMRSLMALAALSLLIGYLEFRPWRRRALIFALCFPLVYVGNVARITAIVVAANFGGQRWGDLAHEVMGYAVFAIVLGGVLAAARLLQRFSPEAGRAAPPLKTTPEIGPADAGLRSLRLRSEIEPTDQSAPVARDVPPSRDRAKRLTGDASPYLVALCVACLAVAEGYLLHRVATLPPAGKVGVVLAADGRDPVELPALLGREWAGAPVPVSEAEHAILPPDTGYSKMRYTSARGAPAVFVSIVLSGRDRTSIHRPELCLVGQGWTITGATRHRFSYPETDVTFPATILHVRRELQTARGAVAVPQLVAYWFVAGDEIVATQWQRMALDAWNRVAHRRVDRWAYVLMQTDAADGDRAALARLQSVLDGTLASFQPGPVQ